MVKKYYYCLGYPNRNFGEFIYGDPSWLRKFDAADWDKKLEFEIISRNCSINPKHKNAIRTAALKVELPSPNLGDFVWTFYSECLITDRVLGLFKDKGFTGFDIKPVEVVKVKRARKGVEYDIPKLWEFIVTGKAGTAHPDSGIRVLWECEGCKEIEYSSYTNGIIVDESKWDGSDFFTVNGYPRYILVTERVKEFVIEQQLINCSLIPSQNLQWGPHIRPEEVYGTVH
jgi:hypothetical protein